MSLSRLAVSAELAPVSRRPEVAAPVRNSAPFSVSEAAVSAPPSSATPHLRAHNREYEAATHREGSVLLDPVFTFDDLYPLHHMEKVYIAYILPNFAM